MGNFQIAFLTISLMSVIAGTPFVFDDSIKTCTNVTKGGKLETNSQTLEVKAKSLKIYFKLCGKFDKSDGNCPAGSIGCLLDGTGGNNHILGKDLVFEDDHLLQSTNGAACPKGGFYALRIRFLSVYQEPSLMKIENCTHHIDVTHPAFKSNCGISLYGRFLDLSPLKRSFKAYSKKLNKTFSVSLCQPDESCGGSDVSACELGSTSTPLASTSSVLPFYIGNNQIVFRGSYKGGSSSSNKKFEVILKCNWEKTEISDNDFVSVDKHVQGKQYSFELETSYGCIKKPIPCIVQDEFLIYNLSDLYSKHHDMWFTEGSPQINGSKFFLQICGAVELSGKNTSCKSTYAQVCENVNGTDINRGSVLSQLEATGDGLIANIEHGMKCKEFDKLQYQTVIYLHCDKENHSPKFFNQAHCVTYFHWRTQSACPTYNSSSCSYIPREYNNNCTFYDNNKYYNLSAFTDTLEVEDQNSPNLQYKINICGSVFEKEAPCLKDVSITRRNSSEPHIKHKIISLGKFLHSTMKNGSLVLEFGSGTYSLECGGDYRSEIRFVCSDFEEKPKLINQTRCHYEFLWKTKYGCPHIANVEKKLETLYNVENCSFTNNMTRQSIDLGFVKPIVFTYEKQMLLFHVCGRVYTNCTLEQKDCTNATFETPNVTFVRNMVILGVNIPRMCSSEHANDFNKVDFHFECEGIKGVSNHGHIRSWKIVECQLNVYYLLDSICSLQDTSDSIEDSMIIHKSTRESDAKTSDHLVHKETLDDSLKLPVPSPKENNLKTAVECPIKSPFTGHALNTSNFTNVFFKNTCPSATFNDTFRYVKLLYSTGDICRPRPTQNISYEVLLFCSPDVKLSPVNEDCLQHYNYQRLEYCEFFKPLTNSSTWIIIGSVIVCIVSIGLLVLGVWARRRHIYWKRSRDGFFSIYHRDAEL